MNILKVDPEQVLTPPTPIETDMTLEEFLQSDLEGYEYVKGELIPSIAQKQISKFLHAKIRLPVKISSKGFRVKSHNFLNKDRHHCPDLDFTFYL